MENKVILVPTDFTEVADTAIRHAVVMAKTVETEVTLLHVVKKDKDIADATTKMEEQAKRVAGDTDIKVNIKVTVGNIFDDIGGVGRDIGARMMVMGTHGAKGMQKLTGSHALKVITNSEVPFIVVQKRDIKPHGYRKIVFPLDLTKESVQPMNIAIEMAKAFNSEVHLIGEGQGDPYLQNKVKANIVFAKKHFNKNGIKVGIKTSSGNKSFDAEVVSYAKSIEADLICVVNYQETFIHLFGNFEQNVIANVEEIPALIINPRTLSKSLSVLFN